MATRAVEALATAAVMSAAETMTTVGWHLIQDVVEMSATIAAQQASIVELELFKSSSLCFIGHMTHDLHESIGEVISSGGEVE